MKGRKMVSEAVKELFERYKSIEHEMSLLKQDRHNLLIEFKDRVGPKAFKAALAVARLKARMTPTVASEFDVALELLSNEISVEEVA